LVNGRSACHHLQTHLFGYFWVAGSSAVMPITQFVQTESS
jgi:hypothetical protein